MPWTGASTPALWFNAGTVVLSAAVLTLTSPASASELPAHVRSNARSAAVDQWSGPLAEAALRTGLPAGCLYDLVRAESNGNALAVSPKGAVGLMQLMPATYAMLRIPLGLGADPLAPRDNILAGAMYLRLLVDRYGWPGALAAYNAGPARLDAFLTRGRTLPAETIAYIWRLAPTHAADLGDGVRAGSPMASTVAFKAQSSAPHETMFVTVASAPLLAPTSAAKPITNHRETPVTWRESSLFAPISGSQARP